METDDRERESVVRARKRAQNPLDNRARTRATQERRHNSNYVSNSHRLGVIPTRKIFSYLLSLGQIPTSPTTTSTDPTPTHPYPGAICFKIEWLPAWVRGKASTKTEVDRFNIFLDILLTDRQTDKRKVRNPFMQSMGGV